MDCSLCWFLGRRAGFCEGLQGRSEGSYQVRLAGRRQVQQVLLRVQSRQLYSLRREMA